DDSAARRDGQVATDLVRGTAEKLAAPDGLPVGEACRKQDRGDREEREQDAKTRVRDRRRHPSPPLSSWLGARSPPTPRELACCRDRLRCDNADRRGADEAEPLRFGLDARRRIQTRALDDEQRVLPAQLVALRHEALGLVAR